MENSSAAPSVAGWHDDPEDPNFRRYSNGRSWTGERVAKDRNINLGSSAKVYRPGGSTIISEESKPEEKAPAPYQPMTRRERRALEADSLGGRNQTTEITEDFEFESAAPATRSYAPAVTPSLFEEFAAPKKIELPSGEDESKAPVVSEKQELSWEDDFETSINQVDEAEEENDADLAALPSLDLGEFAAAPAAPEAVEAEEEKDDATVSLPSLDLGGNDSDELPALLPRVEEEAKAEAKEETEQDEDLDAYSILMADDDEDEKGIEAGEDEPEEETEDEFGSLPPVLAAPSYAAPAPSYAAKPEPKVEQPEEKATEVKPEPELSLDDILDEGPELQEPAPAPVAAPALATDEDNFAAESEPKREAPQYAAPAKKDAPAAKVDVESKDADTEDGTDEDDEPVFGFRSKLNHNFGNGAGTAHDTAMASVTEAAPAPVEESKADDVDDDDDQEEEDDEPRQGIASKFKSLFGRGRSKDVLDEDDDKESDDNESDADDNGDHDGEDDDQEPSETVEREEAVERPAAKGASVVPAKESEDDIEDDDSDDKDGDEDDDEGVEREEPQLRAGLFSSKKEKEDAAVESELLDRLKEIADRVAALKKEEIDVLARIEKAKADEAALKELVDHAHEEHELLDQLAKARRKELENDHSKKEDDHFRDFIETHDKPAGSSVVEPEDEITISAPASVEAQDEEDEDDTATSRLPELKLN